MADLLRLQTFALALSELQDKAVQLGKEEMLFSERETGDVEHDGKYLKRIDRLTDECRALRRSIIDTFC